MANGSGDNGGGNNKKDGATSGAGNGDRTKSEDGRGTEKDKKRDEQKTPGDSSDDAGDSGDDKDDDGPSLPAGYTQVTDKRFHFSMAMPKGFKLTGTAGSNSGAKYSAGGLPKLQVDFSSSPLPDAAAGWRKQEPAVQEQQQGLPPVRHQGDDLAGLRDRRGLAVRAQGGRPDGARAQPRLQGGQFTRLRHHDHLYVLVVEGQGMPHSA